jgi:hypothetical protein
VGEGEGEGVGGVVVGWVVWWGEVEGGVRWREG